MATIVIIFISAIGSIATTFGIWDGAIPSANFKIKVIDKEGKPVNGAKLTIFSKQSFLSLQKTPAYSFPIHQFTEHYQPTSNENGIIKISHICKKRIEISGAAFALFWVIPVSLGDPHFIVTIKASDGRESSFAYDALYRNCDKEPADLGDNDEGIISLANCEYTVSVN
jgi:hypothetical protein